MQEDKSMMTSEMKTDWEDFGGDPCYVLSKENYSKMEKGDLQGIEIHSSPGGAGCWKFKREKPSECVGGENGRGDSGLIAIIPRELCLTESEGYGDDIHAIEGMLFMEYPQLDTADDDRWGTYQAAPVLINNTPCDGYAQCADCSDYTEDDMLEDCDGCGNAFCQNCWCGCDEEE